jgi:uncharacterized protein YkwD
MKHYLLNIFSIATTLLGIATTAQAALNTPQPSCSSIVHTESQPQLIAHLTMNSLELGVYDRINQYRQSLNLQPLGIDPVVSAQARAHSEEMARTGNFKHRVESSAQKLAYPIAAENIATSKGYPQPDLIAVQDWIASPKHQHNAVGRYNLTGIGVAQNTKGEYYFTQIFIYKQQHQGF